MEHDADRDLTTDDRDAASRHVPVMLDEVLELLAPALSTPGAIHVDGTLGMGGHAQAVLESDPQVRLSLIHISEPTRLYPKSRMPSSA